MVGKQFTDLTKASVLKDSDIFAVHDGNGLKKSSMGDVTAYMSDKFRNPNLLINPDFKINQRGATNYESDSGASVNTYSVDRWSLHRHKLAVNSDKSITLANTPSSEGSFSQILENAVEGDVTIQIYVVDVSGSASVLVMPSDGSTVVDAGNLKNGLNVFHYNQGLKKIYIKVLNGTITLKYAKVEQGTVATAYTAPNPIEEYPKCQRYFQYIPKLYCVPLVYTRNLISVSEKFFQATSGNLPTEMRTTPTLTYKALGQSDNSTFTGSASFELTSKSIDTITLDRAISNFTITINGITLDAEIY
jgi:hypothetical protein